MTKIENLTIAEAKQKLLEYKELQNLFNMKEDEAPINNQGLFDKHIGQYVICRTRNEGINAGIVMELDETGILLKDARRLYYHEPVEKNTSWYEGVAKHGLSNSSKTGTTREKLIVEPYSLTMCSEKAMISIKNAADHEQS